MNIAIIGKGGHSKVIEDIIFSNIEYEIVAYLDDQYENVKVINGMYYGPIIAAQKMIGFFDDLLFVIAIGNNRVRKSIARNLGLSERYYATLIHRKAVVSSTAKIGRGTVVMASVVINADAKIGKHTIINTNAVVEHDNKVSDFVHISPSTTLTGAVTVEEGAHIGAGAVVVPNVQIGEWSVIGAGATVIHDIPANCTAVGVPARTVRKNAIGGVL
ncbi:acetyltransferase [Peribacillus loiseleuriae]|uniref:Acetyltransferase n=1 Tax=Peribacillus loiseleuriae TaxID=1679170 RepID=A0A0K9GYS3_9BACI|nr:acetyltransferase [Peribacillus loiseleuriae]KMY51879.1 acetyltransferase [Peribacillus loiseleuriae]